MLRSMLEGSKACWFLIVSLVLVLAKLIVGSHSFRCENLFCRALARLNYPPYRYILSYAPISSQVIGHELPFGSLPGHSLESCDPSITTVDIIRTFFSKWNEELDYHTRSYYCRLSLFVFTYRRQEDVDYGFSSRPHGLRSLATMSADSRQGSTNTRRKVITPYTTVVNSKRKSTQQDLIAL
jgi:hypothetical protein